MKNTLKTKSYWLISIFATGLIFATMFHAGDIYKSEMDILIYVKNPEKEKNIPFMIENIQQILKTLTFYNNILKYSSEINDPVANLSDYERKKYWEEAIQTEKLGESNSIRLSIKGKNKNETEALLNASVSELSWEINKYYDSINPIEIKIIDGPVSNIIRQYSYLTHLAISAAISLLAVYFSFLLSSLFYRENNKSKNFQSKKLSPEETKKRLDQLLEGRI